MRNANIHWQVFNESEAAEIGFPEDALPRGPYFVLGILNDAELYYSRGGFQTQDAAEIWKARKLRELRLDRVVGQSNVTFTLGLKDLGYGGPEEGGWYYDTFQPVRRFTVPASYAERARHWLDVYLKAVNQGRRSISSVLSEGLYVIRTGHVGYEPERRPHYE